jgi:hypothetical protein
VPLGNEPDHDEWPGREQHLSPDLKAVGVLLAVQDGGPGVLNVLERPPSRDLTEPRMPA